MSSIPFLLLNTPLFSPQHGVVRVRTQFPKMRCVVQREVEGAQFLGGSCEQDTMGGTKRLCPPSMHSLVRNLPPAGDPQTCAGPPTSRRHYVTLPMSNKCTQGFCYSCLTKEGLRREFRSWRARCKTVSVPRFGLALDRLRGLHAPLPALP